MTRLFREHLLARLIERPGARQRQAMVWVPEDEDGREFSMRHEDVIFITDTGAENITKWTGSPEEPAVL